MPLWHFCWLLLDLRGLGRGSGGRSSRVKESASTTWASQGTVPGHSGELQRCGWGKAQQSRREGGLRGGMGGMPTDPLLTKVRCLMVGCRCWVRVLYEGGCSELKDCTAEHTLFRRKGPRIVPSL